MIRAASLLAGLSLIVAGLFAANWSGALSLVGTVFGIFAIVGFAVIATGWTEDHDVSD